MSNKRPLVAFILLAMAAQAAIVGCKPSSAESSKDASPPLQVQLVQPKRGPITRHITLPGEVKAYQQATLYAKVAGYLKTITVDKGDQVKDGELLAEIEVPELLADRARYQAEVAVAQLDFNRQSESLKKAPDLVMPQTVDNAKAALDIARANLDRTETLLNYARITAPFSGIVTKRMVDPGAFIPAATTGSTPQNAAILMLADFNTVRVQVAVPELETSLIATDEPVQFKVDGLPGRSFDGKITRYSYALDEASKTMLAEVEMPNPKLELRPGMYASVQIGIERKADALLIPVGALVTEKAGTSVFTVSDGKARKTPVKIGFNDGTNVEIISGVTFGQPVILAGKQALHNGQAVQVGETK
jgi:membrane fusion protein (multidrug efflux system)